MGTTMGIIMLTIITVMVMRHIIFIAGRRLIRPYLHVRPRRLILLYRPIRKV
jgi:hypothetical protein